MRVHTIVRNFRDFSCHFVTFFMYSNGQFPDNFKQLSHSKIKPGVKRVHSRYSYTEESIAAHARRNYAVKD